MKRLLPGIPVHPRSISPGRYCFSAPLRYAAAIAAIALAGAPNADSQTVRRSQHGTVTQMIGTTRVAIGYNRPVARGRQLFGSLVRWGKVWNPGADTATTIAFSDDVLINGKPLAAGTYSLWAIPERETWTIIFSTAHPVFHVPYPAGKDALRVRVTAAAGGHMEVLAFYFPIVEADSALLHLHWGTTVIPISIRVKSASTSSARPASWSRLPA